MPTEYDNYISYIPNSEQIVIIELNINGLKMTKFIELNSHCYWQYGV